MAEGQVFRGFCQSLPHFREVSPCADRPSAYKDGKLSPIGICRSFRFLGGCRDVWLQKFHEWDDRLGRRSLDYAVRGSDGSWQFRPELIRRRLAPVFAAGYRPPRITHALQNVPWDPATAGGRPPERGP